MAAFVLDQTIELLDSLAGGGSEANLGRAVRGWLDQETGDEPI